MESISIPHSAPGGSFLSDPGSAPVASGVQSSRWNPSLTLGAQNREIKFSTSY
jgi:hypothetical protein